MTGRGLGARGREERTHISSSRAQHPTLGSLGWGGSGTPGPKGGRAQCPDGKAQPRRQGAGAELGQRVEGPRAVPGHPPPAPLIAFTCVGYAFLCLVSLLDPLWLWSLVGEAGMSGGTCPRPAPGVLPGAQERGTADVRAPGAGTPQLSPAPLCLPRARTRPSSARTQPWRQVRGPALPPTRDAAHGPVPRPHTILTLGTRTGTRLPGGTRSPLSRDPASKTQARVLPFAGTARGARRVSAAPPNNPEFLFFISYLFIFSTLSF